jgi:prepilin-type N-terminal cleavage/methylation domain-containing protein
MRLALNQRFKVLLLPITGLFSGRKTINNRGFTLVEVTVASILTSILMIGLVNIYVQGLKMFNSSMTQNLMYYETMRAAVFMEAAIRNSTSVDIPEGEHPEEMTLHLYNVNPTTDDNITYRYNRVNRTLRADIVKNRTATFDRRILPITGYNSNHHSNIFTYPYVVRSIEFQDAHELVDNIIVPGRPLVKVNMVLENSSGDTLAFSVTSTCRNQ